ncbi:MAG: hypothetical protein EOM20_16225 [Spartobacteria bacterium]|nr:hypothetical protein [Spartobacteria bacterium]
MSPVPECQPEMTDLSVAAENILQAQMFMDSASLCLDQALHAIARANAEATDTVDVQPVVPPDVPPDEPPDEPSMPYGDPSVIIDTETIQIGGVDFLILDNPLHNLYLVDPRPVLSRVRMINRDTKDNTAFPRHAQTLGEIHGLDWDIDDFCKAVQFGCWVGVARLPDDGLRCDWSCRYENGEWLGVYSSGLRPGHKWYVRTPLETIDPSLANQFVPPMSRAYWVATKTGEKGYNKCDPWPKHMPTLTFAGSYSPKGEYVSEAILQLHPKP